MIEQQMATNGRLVLDDAAIAAGVARAADRPSPSSLIAIRHLGGAVSRVPEEATAYGNRGAQFLASFDACWTDPAADEANVAWTRDAWVELSWISGGDTYVNFAGLGEEEEALVAPSTAATTGGWPPSSGATTRPTWSGLRSTSAPPASGPRPSSWRTDRSRPR